MFTEYSFAGACCSSNWVDTIQNCLFDTLADDYFWDNYVDNTLNVYGQNYPPICSENGFAYFPNSTPDLAFPNRCHLIDLSPYTEVWLNLDPSRQFYCITGLVCPRGYWRPPYNSILSNNQYRGKRNESSPCYLCPPNDNYE